MAKSEKRLPRTDIPGDLACRLCDFQGKNEQSYISHAAAKHGLKYELKEDPTGRMQRWRQERAEIDPEAFKLQPWHRLALARHVAYGTSIKAIAEEMGKGSGSLYTAKNSPAGIAYMQEIEEQMDPKFMVQNLLDAASLNLMWDWMQAWEWAKGARDYDALHRMAKDIGFKRILDRDVKDDTPTQITINLGSADLAAAQAETTGYIPAEVLEDEGEDD